MQKLCESEEQKIAANPQYRTPPRTLKRLAEAHMFYELPAPNRFVSGQDLSNAEGFVAGHDVSHAERLVSGHDFSRAAIAAKSSPALAAEGRPGPWDTFSLRTLGLRTNRRMARDFESDSQKISQASTAAVTQALKLNPARWTPIQKQSLETWSLVLAQIPNLTRWSPNEKRQLINIIRAKSAPNEMSYLRQTQRHPRLRAELLRLGSTP
jgi:hypothetical protein